MNTSIKIAAFAAGLLSAASAYACPDDRVCGIVLVKGSGLGCFHFAVGVQNPDGTVDVVGRGGISYKLTSESVQGRIAAIPDVGKTVSFLKGGVIQNCQGVQTTFEALDINSPAIP